MNTTSLEDFVSTAITRNRITFGDVRRLQRDYLPGGFATLEQAEVLICLDAKISRADKDWGRWLVAAVTDLAVKQAQRDDTESECPAEWLERLLAGAIMPAKLGRRIAPHVRREAERLRATVPVAETRGAGETTVLPDRIAADAGTDDEPAETKPEQRIRVAITSQIILKPSPATRPARRPKQRPTMLRIAPPLIWSSGMAEKHLRFQFAAPYP